MAYRDRQKISQMTPKGANLEATDLIEVSTVESGSYVTKSITGQEIINAGGGGGSQDLQQVTDNGNTTTNDVYAFTFQTGNGDAGKAKLLEDGSVECTQLLVYNENTSYYSKLKNDDTTNTDVILQFPDKINGSYTIATTSDLTSGTVTSVGLTTGTTGTDINVTSSPITSSGDITLNIPIAGASSTGKLSSTDWTTFNNKGNGTVTSVDLTMPSAFTVSGNPITTSGTLAVTGAGVVSQYVRGDGSLANFPSVSGGGASTSYYLNGSVNQGTIGGVTYYEMNKTPILGAGTDFIRTNGAGNGYIASFLTDANDPNLLKIPGGNWNLEFYFSASSSGSTPSFYVELYKYNGTTFTLLASNSASPEIITGGTSIDAYFTTLSVPETILLATDRLAIRVYVTTAGRTITLHTEDNHLCQVITTFTTGLTALNGLTDQVQNFATGTSGTDFGISSSGSTHTFNLPTASATNRGALSTTDWSAFNGKASYTPRVQTVASAATVTPVSTNDLVKITAQAAALALANPTGTWDEGQPLMIRIKDNGTARAITYDTNYRAIGVTLPTTTVVSKTTYLGLIYNATDTKWDVIGVTTQA
jgi:hypothetical protein